MALPQVVIVGRPNVGKSSLLNALAGRRISIVDPRPGITRDRVTAVLEHQDRFFELVDTGGIGIVDADHLEEHVEQQIQYAIQQAAIVIFLVDVRDGLTPLDQIVAARLRKLQQPVVLVANKVDAPSLEPEAAIFARLGCGAPHCVSAQHGGGRLELLDRIVELLGAAADAPPEAPVMKLAIVGKRNAGKSTFVNALAGEERMIVSETPGTTRDAVDVRFEKDGRAFIAIDTAGVRKKNKMQDIDFYSYTRALQAIQRADVVLHLIDAAVPVSEVDLKLAQSALDEYKPIVLGVNKWDLAEGRTDTGTFGDYLLKVMPALDFAPVAFLTAKTGQNADAVVDVALSLHRQAHERVSTGRLNAALEEVIQRREPTAKHGAKLVKLYYATQAAVAPPTIVFFCNDPELVREDYRRFMENRLRELLPFSEVPIRLVFRARQRERAPAK